MASRHKTLLVVAAVSALSVIPRCAQAASNWKLYTTADGISVNSTWSIDEDTKGYLWFTTAFDGASRYDGIRFENINTTHGLISNNIYFTLADKKGNFWFATDRGLSLYDGEAFRNYDVSDGLAGNTVTFIFEDSKNNIWFATDKGVSRFDGVNFQTIPDAAEDMFCQVTFMLETADGDLWFGTTRGIRKYGGLRLLPGSTANVADRVNIIFEDGYGNLWFGTQGGLYRRRAASSRIEGPLIESAVTSIVEDTTGNLWLATEYQGVITYNIRADTFESHRGMLDNKILSMLVDSRGDLWFGSDNGITLFAGGDVKHLTNVNGVSLRFVRSILEDGDANLWFATENGIYKYAVDNLQRLNQEVGLVSNSVTSILEDREGNVWLGSAHGVSKYDGETFHSFTARDGLVDIRVLTIFEDSRGNLWIGTAAGLHKNVHSGNGEVFLRDTAVRAIREDGRGHLWLATTDGIYRHDGRDFEFFPIEAGLGMVMDMNGSLWIGSWESGIYRYSEEEGFKRYDLEDGLSSNHVTWMLQARDGNLWFGLRGGMAYGSGMVTTRGGVCRWDGKSFKSFTTDDGLPSQLITCAVEDDDASLWLGSDKGVARIDSRVVDGFSVIQVMEKEDGLISNYVKSMLLDREGHLWMGTDKGASKYDGENFQNIRLDEDLTLGFVENIFEDRQGSIYFITSRSGIIKYTPPAKEILPRVHITQVEADQVYRQVADDIRIPTQTRLVTFAYKAISFRTKPDYMRFSYKLEGHDTAWHPSTSDRRVHYSNLKPGHYQFQVRAIDEDLHYSDPPATASIVVFRPFYRSALFVVLAILSGGLGTAGVSYLAIQLRRQRRIAAQFHEKLLKKKESERIQTAKMDSLRQMIAGIAHEINNPIGAILSSNDVSDRAVCRVKEILTYSYPEETKRNEKLTRTFSILEDTGQVKKIAAAKIATIVANLRRFVRLDEAEWQAADIHDGLDSVIALMASEFENKVEIIKEYGEVPRIHCSPGSLNQVFLAVLRNALESISEKGQIRITTSAPDEYLRIEVSDTGVGIPENQIARIFDPGFTTKGVQVGVGLGLTICYDIITQRHRGRIDLASEVGKGTTVTILLPRSQGTQPNGTMESRS